jgi:hypothetical protein
VLSWLVFQCCPNVADHHILNATIFQDIFKKSTGYSDIPSRKKSKITFPPSKKKYPLTVDIKLTFPMATWATHRISQLTAAQHPSISAVKSSASSHPALPAVKAARARFASGGVFAPRKHRYEERQRGHLGPWNTRCLMQEDVDFTEKRCDFHKCHK